MRAWRVVIGILLSFLASGAWAESERGGAILLEEIGARQIGSAGAAVAYANDILALYANPAGLSSSDNYSSFVELGSDHSRDFWMAASMAVPIQRRATLAIGYRRLNASRDADVPRLTNRASYGRFVSPFHEDDAVIELGLGRFVRPDLSIGFAARYVSFQSSSLDYPAERYQGLHGELGLRHNSAIKGIVIGASVRNFGAALKDGAVVDLPVTAAVGLSWGKLYRTVHYVNLSADLVKSENSKAGFRAGAEYWLANFLALRGGYDAVESRREGYPFHGKWSLGASVNFRGALLDVAVVPSSSDEIKIAAGLRLTSSAGRRKR